jgi:hypothetical protein
MTDYRISHKRNTGIATVAETTCCVVGQSDAHVRRDRACMQTGFAGCAIWR